MENEIALELFGAVTGLIYIFLEIKQKRAMWIIGGISAMLYILVFINTGLYASVGLQLYFLVMSLYGWLKWGVSSKGEGGAAQSVCKLSVKNMLLSLLLFVLGYILLNYILRVYSNDPAPEIDALIAAVSMIATWWVAKKFIENWILWIIANSLAVYLYVNQELYATAILYFVYLAAAVAGFWSWRKFPKSLN